MVNDVSVQFGEVCGGVVLGLHNFTVVTSSGKCELPPASFVNGEMVWLVSYKPDDVSGDAVGAGGEPTVAVMVADAVRFKRSVA